MSCSWSDVFGSALDVQDPKRSGARLIRAPPKMGAGPDAVRAVAVK